MSEFMVRSNKAHDDAIEASKSGMPTPGRSTSPDEGSW